MILNLANCPVIFDINLNISGDTNSSFFTLNRPNYIVYWFAFKFYTVCSVQYHIRQTINTKCKEKEFSVGLTTENFEVMSNKFLLLMYNSYCSDI